MWDGQVVRQGWTLVRVAATSCSCTWELSARELQMSMSCGRQVYITSLQICAMCTKML